MSALSRRGLFGFFSATALAPVAFAKGVEPTLTTAWMKDFVRDNASIKYSHKTYSLGYAITRDIVEDYPHRTFLANING